MDSDIATRVAALRARRAARGDSDPLNRLRALVALKVAQGAPIVTAQEDLPSMTPQAIAARAAELIAQGHWAAATLRSAFSFAVAGAGAYPARTAGVYPDYQALIAFERHWIGARHHRNDGQLISETAADRAARVGPADTVAALRAFAALDSVEG